MERVTRKTLENMLRILARMTGAKPGDTQTPGSLFIETDSPGDGWTRYSVMVVTSAGGRRHLGTSRGWNAAECYAYLNGLMDGREADKRIAEQTTKTVRS